jgi:hypothetical protein
MNFSPTRLARAISTAIDGIVSREIDSKATQEHGKKNDRKRLMPRADAVESVKLVAGLLSYSLFSAGLPVNGRRGTCAARDRVLLQASAGAMPCWHQAEMPFLKSSRRPLEIRERGGRGFASATQATVTRSSDADGRKRMADDLTCRSQNRSSSPGASIVPLSGESGPLGFRLLRSSSALSLW